MVYVCVFVCVYTALYVQNGCQLAHDKQILMQCSPSHSIKYISILNGLLHAMVFIKCEMSNVTQDIPQFSQYNSMSSNEQPFSEIYSVCSAANEMDMLRSTSKCYAHQNRAHRFHACKTFTI